MQELKDDIIIEKKLGFITDHSCNRILDYIDTLYLEKEKEHIIHTYWEAYKEGQYSGDKTAEEYYNERYNGKIPPCVGHELASQDEEEANKRMDIIGQNGNEGIHYDNKD